MGKGSTGKYAVNTSVSVSKTKADIEELLIRHGAKQFVSGFKDSLAVIGFELDNRQIKIYLELPKMNDAEFQFTPGRGTQRSADAAYNVWQQACKAKWRSLYAIIKAKLIAVEENISTIERKFFYDVILPDGQTVGEYLAPQLEVAYHTGNMPPLLPMI